MFYLYCFHSDLFGLILLSSLLPCVHVFELFIILSASSDFIFLLFCKTFSNIVQKSAIYSVYCHYYYYYSQWSLQGQPVQYLICGRAQSQLNPGCCVSSQIYPEAGSGPPLLRVRHPHVAPRGPQDPGGHRGGRRLRLVPGEPALCGLRGELQRRAGRQHEALLRLHAAACRGNPADGVQRQRMCLLGTHRGGHESMFQDNPPLFSDNKHLFKSELDRNVSLKSWIKSLKTR